MGITLTAKAMAMRYSLSSTLVKPKAFAMKGTSQTRVVSTREPRRPGEGLVHVVHLEEAAALRAHVEAVENLGHAHGDEGHGRAVRAVGYLPDAGLDIVPDKVAREGEDGNHQA